MGHLLLGNNLAVLVAAYELGKKGEHVTVLTDGDRPGGHFGGLTHDGVTFDIGTVYFEFAKGALASTDITTYNPRQRYDWTRFGAAIESWIRERHDVVESPPPQCLVEGKIIDDYLIADHLDDLPQFDIVPPDVTENSNLHPRHKLHEGTAYDEARYAEAARANHGHDFQSRMIEPFLDKVLAGTDKDFLARYHRAVWLPLFYPETLSKALRGEAEHGLRPHSFHVLKEGASAALVAQLHDTLQTMPNITFHTHKVAAISRDTCDDYTITLDNNDAYTSSTPIVGLSSKRMAELLSLTQLDTPDASSLSFSCALVRDAALQSPISCLMVLDPEYHCYRITNQDAARTDGVEWRRITIEMNPDFKGMSTDPEEIQNVAMTELRELLSIDDGRDIQILKSVHARNILPLPTSAYVDDVNRLSDDIRSRNPNMILTGTLLGFGVGTMNDQILQGLIAAKS